MVTVESLDPEGPVINYQEGSRSSYTPTKRGMGKSFSRLKGGGGTQKTISVSRGVAQKIRKSERTL